MMKVETYLSGIAIEPSAVMIPITMAQDFLDLSRTAVLDLIKGKQLEEIRVSAGDKQYRGVTAGSLRKYREGMLPLNTASTILEQYLVRVVVDAPSAKAEDIAINYAPVMEELDLSWRSPADRKTIGGLLDGVSRRSNADTERGFLLSAVVVLKATDLPSNAFFDLAIDLNMIDEEADEATKRDFWNAQMKFIAKHYRHWR
jgi:hypothetical protein